MRKYTFYVTHYLDRYSEDKYALLDTRDNFQITGINKDALKSYIGRMSIDKKVYSVHFVSIPKELNKIEKIG